MVASKEKDKEATPDARGKKPSSNPSKVNASAEVSQRRKKGKGSKQVQQKKPVEASAVDKLGQGVGNLLDNLFDMSKKQKKKKKGPRTAPSSAGPQQSVMREATKEEKEEKRQEKRDRTTDKTEKTEKTERNVEQTKEDEDVLPDPWKNPLTPEAETAIDTFVQHHVVNLGAAGLKTEFQTWKAWIPPQFVYEAFNANINRNRYRDVVCLDHTRVVLTLQVPPETDYIHANTVKIEGCDRNYIAVQAPLDATISDHWRLVHQEEAGVMLNLSQFVEAGKAKCSEYWPMKSGDYKTFGKMFVNNKKVLQKDGFDIYSMEVLPEGCSNSTMCKLIHMTTWPDRGVPTDHKTILKLLKNMYTFAGVGTVIVHCSAGIGRSGTVIAVDFIISRLLKGKDTKMVEIFQSLRSQRASSIQTESQYVFVIQVILAFIQLRTGPKYTPLIKQFNDSVVALNLG